MGVSGWGRWIISLITKPIFFLSLCIHCNSVTNVGKLPIFSRFGVRNLLAASPASPNPSGLARPRRKKQQDIGTLTCDIFVHLHPLNIRSLDFLGNKLFSVSFLLTSVLYRLSCSPFVNSTKLGKYFFFLQNYGTPKITCLLVFCATRK